MTNNEIKKTVTVNENIITSNTNGKAVFIDAGATVEMSYYDEEDDVAYVNFCGGEYSVPGYKLTGK